MEISCQEVKDAIKHSTTKWVEISHDIKHDAGSDDCELCNLFRDDECDECPIANTANETTCYGTPYEEWCKHHHNDHYHKHWLHEFRVNDCIICKQIALEEALFIYSLL